MKQENVACVGQMGLLQAARYIHIYCIWYVSVSACMLTHAYVVCCFCFWPCLFILLLFSGSYRYINLINFVCVYMNCLILK